MSVDYTFLPREDERKCTFIKTISFPTPPAEVKIFGIFTFNEKERTISCSYKGVEMTILNNAFGFSFNGKEEINLSYSDSTIILGLYFYLNTKNL